MNDNITEWVGRKRYKRFSEVLNVEIAAGKARKYMET